VDDNTAGLMLFQPVDATDHRGLAGARWPADYDALATSDFEIDVAQHVEVAVPLVHGDDLHRYVGREPARLACGSSRSFGVGHDAASAFVASGETRFRGAG